LYICVSKVPGLTVRPSN